MSPHTARDILIFDILNLVCVVGHEGCSIKSPEIACYRRKRKKDEGKGGKEG